MPIIIPSMRFMSEWVEQKPQSLDHGLVLPGLGRRA
jgi:hypothetical protein